MRLLTVLGLLFIFTLTTFTPILATDQPLPKSLTDAERKLINDDFDGYLKSVYSSYDKLDNPRKPVGNFFTPGEFEKSEGICFSWAGYSSLLTQLIKESSQDAKVYVAVSSYSADSAKKSLIAAGAKAENLKMITTHIDSVWMRDFGPYFIHTKDGSREIIDCRYNRPRPNDDKFPTTLGDFLNITVHPCRLIMPGGNFQTDGHGVAIMTDVVFDPSEGGDPNMSVAQLEAYMKDYFGMKRTIIIKDMRRDGTGHCDMFSKLLDDRNMIVGEYATPGDGASGNYEILNENARVLAQEKNGLGQNFIITRIPMPKYDGRITRTHTNSTILNNKVLVPIYNRGTDKTALAVYQKLLPNHKIIGFDCNNIISANGAIHCITKLVMADPLDIQFTQTKANITKGKDYFLKFNLLGSHANLATNVNVHWAISAEGPFLPLTAENFGKGLYTASIPTTAAQDKIWFFISAETADGLYETSPANTPQTLHSVDIY